MNREYTLDELGFESSYHDEVNASDGLKLSAGRISAVHRERYTVLTTGGEKDGEITGNLRYGAREKSDFPAVGDWVLYAAYEDNSVLIHKVLGRKSILYREAVGATGERQVIATNVDSALLVQAADRDFNLNRLERYLAICNSAAVTPLLVINKCDLATDEELKEMIEAAARRAGGIVIHTVSTLSGKGVEALSASMERGKTYCMLGSSGVGKSTLLNRLTGSELMETSALSSSTGKGRHTTSHRELVLLENGAILIDNPGMREVGTVAGSGALELTFDEIAARGDECRYDDCTHTTEGGCAVIEAVERGEIDRQAWENYLKLRREQHYFDSTESERRRRGKDLSKILKNYKKGGYKGR